MEEPQKQKQKQKQKQRQPHDDGDDDDANPNSKAQQQQQKKQQTVCGECRENPSKYNCPACSLRSCSLPCVKAHKQRTGCTGKRDQTHFVPLSSFDDRLLFSDYNLLEEMKRVAESSQRMRAQFRVHPYPRFPPYLRTLVHAAANRKAKLLLLPTGMSKRDKNQTRYNPRKKFISWTIEWRFHSTDVILLDHGVHEDTNLCSVIEKHLKPGPWNHPLRQFCEENLDSLKFFIQKNPKGSKSAFCELDIKFPLRQQLADVVILEYPVIHVFLPSHNFDFEVLKKVYPDTNRTGAKDSISNDYASQQGVAFPEEEIEEDKRSSDLDIYDIIKDVKLGSLHGIFHHNVSEKASDNGPLLEKVTSDNSLNSSSKVVEPRGFDNMEFDFDEELLDSYRDLISQFNPDDFLDLEGECAFQAERQDPSDSGQNLLVEELEEGEIAE